MKLTRLFLAAAIGLSGAACKKSDKAKGPTTAKIAELGISVELPEGFSVSERNGGQWIGRSNVYAAKLTKGGAMPKSVDEAIAGFMSGDVVDKGEIGGGFFAVINVEFPSAEGPLKLPHVFVQIPVGSASVLCTGQLQPGDDAKALVAACGGIKAL